MKTRLLLLSILAALLGSGTSQAETQQTMLLRLTVEAVPELQVVFLPEGKDKIGSQLISQQLKPLEGDPSRYQVVFQTNVRGGILLLTTNSRGQTQTVARSPLSWSLRPPDRVDLVITYNVNGMRGLDLIDFRRTDDQPRLDSMSVDDPALTPVAEISNPVLTTTQTITVQVGERFPILGWITLLIVGLLLSFEGRLLWRSLRRRSRPAQPESEKGVS